MNEKDWKSLFESRRGCEHSLPWHDPYLLTPVERDLVLASIRQFQLGEGSDGCGLVRRALASRLVAADPEFVPTLQLFIAEEQRHSWLLRQFLHRENTACLEGHWVDQVFRRVRKFAGLELCLSVLVSAEIVAMPYYSALTRATESQLLRAICRQILRDEAGHLRYQADNLRRLRALRPWRFPWAEWWLWRAFFWTTLTVVWRHHGPVLRAGGYKLSSFRKECVALLREVDGRRSEQSAVATRSPAASQS
jgi:hypothetical protein